MHPPIRYPLAPITVALACALGGPNRGFAEEAPPPADPVIAPSTRVTDTIVVTATRTERNPLDVPASVDLIRHDDIHDGKARVNASETLDRIAGVVALNRQNYAQDLQISIRGFGARSSFGVRGLRLYVDGVPATLPDGQGQASNFPLNAAERIEVLRGPFSALYGNSSGGVIAVTTALKPTPTGGELSFAAGTNNTQRSAVDLAGGTAPYAYAVDAESFHTGGYRKHSATGRSTLNLRGALLDTPIGRLRLAINALNSDNAQDPLGLSRAQLQQNPDQTTSEAFSFNTRKSTHQDTAGADLRTELGPVRLQTSLWLGARAITQFQAIPPSTQRPAGFPQTAASRSSPGGVIDLGRHFGGIDSRVTFDNGAWSITAGFDFERLVEDRFGDENVLSPLTGAISSRAVCGRRGLICGVIGHLRRDETNSVNSLDPYAQTELAILPSWRLLAGVRASYLSFDSSDHFLANGNDSGAVSYHGVNPTAGVVFRPTPQTSVYLSYGRGFETPTLNELSYKPDGSAGLNTSLGAARSDNVELGAKADLGSAARASLALFSTRTDDDIVVRSNAGGRSGYANVGQTRRDGIEASFEAPLTRAWSIAASAALIHARFDVSFLTCAAAPCRTPTLPVASGNKLPSVPARTAWTELKYRSGVADLSIEARAQSALWVDDRNTDHAGGSVVFNAVAQRTIEWSTLRPHVFARVDNLANRRYVGSVIVNEANGRFFEPAPTRTWLLGVDLPF
jgi:iron complex outermembrane recepter protein